MSVWLWASSLDTESGEFSWHWFWWVLFTLILVSSFVTDCGEFCFHWFWWVILDWFWCQFSWHWFWWVLLTVWVSSLDTESDEFSWHWFRWVLLTWILVSCFHLDSGEGEFSSHWFWWVLLSLILVRSLLTDSGELSLHGLSGLSLYCLSEVFFLLCGIGICAALLCCTIQTISIRQYFFWVNLIFTCDVFNIVCADSDFYFYFYFYFLDNIWVPLIWPLWLTGR